MTANDAFEDAEFALCLTHDVDRLSKTYQGPYYAVKERSLHHLAHYFTGERPYWQFEKIVELEDRYDVRSSFYFLNEKRLFTDKPPTEWLDATNWKLFAGRYDVTDDAVVEIVRELDRDGWEVGLHGSYESYRDPERLRYEKETLEAVLGDSVLGGRQHYLNLDRPETWAYQRAAGLKYDASLGSSTEYGFEWGDGIYRPFDDDFAVFPTTVMDVALMNDHDSVDDAWETCESLLREASARDAVMTVLWHPRVFNERDFPGYVEIYERLLRRARELNAWIGPVEAAYAELVRSQPEKSESSSVHR